LPDRNGSFRAQSSAHAGFEMTERLAQEDIFSEIDPGLCRSVYAFRESGTPGLKFRPYLVLVKILDAKVCFTVC